MLKLTLITPILRPSRKALIPRQIARVVRLAVEVMRIQHVLLELVGRGVAVGRVTRWTRGAGCECKCLRDGVLLCESGGWEDGGEEGEDEEFAVHLCCLI